MQDYIRFCDRKVDFNPRAPCGARRLPRLRLALAPINFNPRAPCGARHAAAWTRSGLRRISIHVPLAGHDTRQRIRPGFGAISIHVPLAGHDPKNEDLIQTKLNFNPRAPCGARPDCLLGAVRPAGFSIHVPLAGHDPVPDGRAARRERFQSTCPLRGTTRTRAASAASPAYFNPRAPCGARHGGHRGTRGIC